MKNKLHRIAAILLLLAFLPVNCCIAADHTAEKLDMYSGKELKAYEDSAEIFRHLQIFEVEEDIQSIVTRAQFVGLLTKLLGINDFLESAGAEGRYKDLNDNNAYEMEYAVSHGLINEYSRDEFRPDDYILFEDAVRGILNGLGYGFVVEAEDSGKDEALAYISRAASAGILKGVSQTKGYPVTYGKLLTMLKNALSAELVCRTYSDSEKKYFISESSTILNKVYKCEEREGIVTANSYTDIKSGLDGTKGIIKIDDCLYEYPELSESLIGQRVKYYVREDKGSEALMYVFSVQEDKDFLFIDGEEIESFENRQYEYYDKAVKKRRQAIPSGCVIIYNGKTVTDFFQQQDRIRMIPESGFVRFIDNNKDGRFDVCVIESYETFVVGAVDREKQEIFDKYTSGKHLSLDGINDDLIFIENLNGAAAAFQSIKVNQVLSAAVSADNKLVRIIVSDRSVSGVIERMDEDSVTVNGTEYKLNCDDMQGFGAGKNGRFLLDKDNKIVCFEPEPGVSMGYLIRASIDDSDSTLSLKVLNSAGSVELLSCAGALYIDDVRVKSHEQGYDILKAAGIPGVFTYISNSDGDICKIYTLYTGSRSRCPESRLQPNTSVSNIYTTYNSATASFRDSKTFLDGGTVIFCVPDNPQNADNDEFFVCGAGDLAGDAGYGSAEKPLKSYILGDKSLTASCMVINSGYLSKGYRIGIVCGLTSKIDENDEKYEHIDIFNYGKVEEYRLYDEGIDINKLSAGSALYASNSYKLRVGDLVLYDVLHKGGKKILKRLVVMYDTDSGEYVYLNPPGTSAQMTSTYYFGDVYEKSGNYLSVVLSGGEMTLADTAEISVDFDRTKDNYFVDNIGNASICKFNSDAKGGEVLIGLSKDEIVDYMSSPDSCSRVFVFTECGNAVFCYIVN
ncbi:MAG: S-layer homology domain-containing protein [Clostridia bacterium]|nr:S-layer homology domain-containing protein [Clostridia bacterium]